MGKCYTKKKDQVVLTCIDSSEASKIIEEIHEGICGTHANGHRIARQVMKASYYWLTLESDCCRCPIFSGLLCLFSF